ncbi:MAG: hypothetical protein AAFY91_11925, partial [Bacteroidota bacterium]
MTSTLDGTTSTVSYTYPSNFEHFNPLSETILGPGGTRSNTYRYSKDLGASHQFLTDANMVGIPIETDMPDGSTLKLDIDQNLLVPKRMVEQFSPTYSVDKYLVEEYTTLGYPKKIRTFGFDHPIEYTWSGDLVTSKTYLEHSESWNYYPNRNLEWYIPIEGPSLKTTYTYDGLQRLKTITARQGGIFTEYDYTIGGPNEITSETIYSDDDVVNTTRQTFDGLGRPLDSYVNGELQEGQRYDRYGRVSTRTFMPGRWLNRIIYEPSPLNRVEREIYPDASTIRYQYIVQEGYNGVRVFDEKNNPTTTLTDVFGRTRVSIDALGGRTEYEYEIWDAPSEIIPPLGPKYEYTYNPLRQLESKTIPGGGTTNYRYDEMHRLAATQTAQGDIVGNTYDSYSRLHQTYLRENGSLPTPGTSFNPTGTDDLLTEDLYVAPGGNPQDDINRLMQSSVRFLDNNGNMAVTDFTYDSYGRVINQVESFTLAGQSFTNTNTVNTAFLTHRDLP